MIEREFDENNKNDCRWMAHYEVLLAYIKASGTIYMPERKKGEKLEDWKEKMIAWCTTQRMKYRSGRLMSWQYDKLISIGFSFDPLGDRIEENYRELLEFRDKYGHTRVPATSEEYPILATWVQTLRFKPPTGELKERLDAVGFVWRAKTDNWDIKYRELLQFRNKHGHMDVPLVYEGSSSLNSWMKMMRKLKRRKDKGHLTDERIRLLDAIGFEWNPREAGWEKNYQKLSRYMRCNGGKLIPLAYKHDKEFVNWLNQLRIRKNQLPKNKLDMLNALGFDWTPKKAGWENRYEELCRYKEEHGNCRVPFLKGKNEGFYAWTNRMRATKDSLPQDRIDLLDSIGFEWEVKRLRGKPKPVKRTKLSKNSESKAPGDTDNVATTEDEKEMTTLQHLLDYY